MPSRATREKIQAISMVMVAHWAQRVKHPLDTLRGLEDVGRALNCDIQITDGLPSYAPILGRDGPAGKALINLNQDFIWVIRGGAHELSHHTLYWWTCFWPWSWDFPGEEHLIDAIEEAICDAVANLVWPLPDRMQANGKPAIPVSDGPVLRCGWHNPIPSSMAMPAQEIEAADAREGALFLPAETNLNSPI